MKRVSDDALEAFAALRLPVPDSWGLAAAAAAAAAAVSASETTTAAASATASAVQVRSTACTVTALAQVPGHLSDCDNAEGSDSDDSQARTVPAAASSC